MNSSNVLFTQLLHSYNVYIVQHHDIIIIIYVITIILLKFSKKILRIIIFIFLYNKPTGLSHHTQVLKWNKG